MTHNMAVNGTPTALRSVAAHYRWRYGALA